jgi:hypothetical protein
VAVAFADDAAERRAAAEAVAFADASALSKTELQGPAELLLASRADWLSAPRPLTTARGGARSPRRGRS